MAYNVNRQMDVEIEPTSSRRSQSQDGRTSAGRQRGPSTRCTPCTARSEARKKEREDPVPGSTRARQGCPRSASHARGRHGRDTHETKNARHFWHGRVTFLFSGDRASPSSETRRGRGGGPRGSLPGPGGASKNLGLRAWRGRRSRGSAPRPGPPRRVVLRAPDPVPPRGFLSRADVS